MGAAKNRMEAIKLVDACANCEAFKPIPGTKGGFCRAHAPVPMLVGMGQGIDGKPFPVVNSYHPQMPGDGWCREHVRGVGPGLMPQPIATAEEVSSALAGLEAEGTA